MSKAYKATRNVADFAPDIATNKAISSSIYISIINSTRNVAFITTRNIVENDIKNALNKEVLNNVES